MSHQKHEFALYAQGLNESIASAAHDPLLEINDAILAHRIAHVLRLKKDDFFILFDRFVHVKCVLKRVEHKKNIICRMITREPNQRLSPRVSFLLPLLKRDDLQRAVYSLVEVGANSIQLIITQKVQRSWGGIKELERLKRIVIAAAEQSKYFAFPELCSPISFLDALKNLSSVSSRIFFDPEGLPIINHFNVQGASLALMVGPEGDLTSDEKHILEQNNFVFCSLTPTILRSVQAAAVGLGAVRAITMPNNMA